MAARSRIWRTNADGARVKGILASLALHAVLLAAVAVQLSSRQEEPASTDVKPITVLLVHPPAKVESSSARLPIASGPRRLPVEPAANAADGSLPLLDVTQGGDADEREPAITPSPQPNVRSLATTATRVDMVTPTPEVSNLRDEYAQRLWQRIEARRPRGTRLKGETNLTFSVDRSGALISLSITKTSGNKQLDLLATRAVRTTAPFPAPPAQLGDADLQFSLTFSFS